MSLQVQLALQAKANFFNALNGFWEPALEPWRVHAAITMNRTDGAGGDGGDEESSNDVVAPGSLLARGIELEATEAMGLSAEQVAAVKVSVQPPRPSNPLPTALP